MGAWLESLATAAHQVLLLWSLSVWSNFGALAATRGPQLIPSVSLHPLQCLNYMSLELNHKKYMHACMHSVCTIVHGPLQCNV